ncbi:MAG: TonB-dependent receptor [Tannerellaceae bacterium]|nr:TonB-dependent receptor [Tannerellaceae bacterium]
MMIKCVFVFLVNTNIMWADMTYAQKTSLNLDLTNVELEEVFEAIRRQSEFDFFYSNDHVDTSVKVSVQLKNADITNVLDKVLPAIYEYKINDRYILISKRKEAETTPPASSAARQPRSIPIKGTVSDATGEPIIGANIMEKGTNNGVISDINGGFSLNVSPNAVLTISYIGYVPQEITVGSKTSFAIVLRENTQNLSEIVVVGYGTQKRANLTGAVNTISSERISNRPVTSLMSALSGEASGLTIIQSSGQAGANDQQSMRVRGVGTWGDSAPLVLVDGIAMNINDVIPSEVESVTVLKDAASASIYGSRAANGVILITTKQGEKGKMRLSYTANFGITMPTRIPEMVNTWQYAEMFNEGMLNEGTPSGLWPQDKIDRIKAGNGDIDLWEGTTDWYREVLNYAAPQHTHQVTASGGNEAVTYMGSLGYSKQEGIIPNTPYERYNARINTKSQLTAWLKLGFNLTFQNSNRTEPSNGARNAFNQLARALPYMPPKYSDGTWSFLSIQTNPLRKVNGDYGLTTYTGNVSTIQISPEISPLKGLLIKGTLGYESNTYLTKRFDKTVQYEAFSKAGQPATTDGVYGERNRQTDTWRMNRNLTADLTATYDFTQGRHEAKIMGGGSIESFKMNMTSGSRYDFPSNDYTEINAGDPATGSADGDATYAALASLFGRLNYAYAGKYLFEANFRYDGSSKFARGNRWGLFPSVSAGWRISEESFFNGLKPLIPNLKLRASWGILGNQSIDNYQFVPTFAISGNYVFGSSAATGYGEALMANELITWEDSENLNFGLDFSLLDSRLDVVFDWYKKNTNNILLRLPAPATVGLSGNAISMSNAGSVENKGWELSLNWRDKLFDKINYRVGFNLSDVKNKITDLGGYTSPTNTLTTRIEGQPIDALFGYETIGICMTQEEYDKYAEVMHTFDSRWAIGDLILKDRNGNNRIDSDDKKVIGNQIPRYTFGFSFGFDYKHFDFSAFLQGVGKKDGYVTNVLVKPLNNISGRVDHYEKTFHPAAPNQDAIFPRYHATWEYNYETYQSYWVQNASYLRLKNMQIGYSMSFPESGISQLRFMLTGENIFTLTKFMAWDPETAIGSSSVYPLTAVYSFGVNITF